MAIKITYVGEFTSRRRRVGVGEFAHRRVDWIPTAFILNLHQTTTLFPTVPRGPIVAHNPLFEFKTLHISKFLWSWVKHYRGVTCVNTDVKDLQARIVHVIVTSRTLTPISLRVFKFSRGPAQVTGYLKHLRRVLFVFQLHNSVSPMKIIVI